ncbi:MAG TPA: ribosome silencing factor [Polyangiaceae bacterium]
MTLLGKPKLSKTRTPQRPAKRTAGKSTERRVPTRPTPSEEAKRIALLVATAGLDKKATGVDILDVTGKVDYADYLVLMTGQNDRHVAAIAHAVDDALRKGGVHSVSVEGLPAARWVLIDFVDVVVHVFLEETRSLYDLDGLWLDARKIPVLDATAPSVTATPKPNIKK